LRLKEGGVIAVHVSNRYLDLAVPLKAASDNFGLSMVDIIDRNPASKFSSPSDWILLSYDREKLEFELKENTSYRDFDDLKDGALWTDDFSSILPILKI
jgi:hypothetical protein